MLSLIKRYIEKFILKSVQFFQNLKNKLEQKKYSRSDAEYSKPRRRYVSLLALLLSLFTLVLLLILFIHTNRKINRYHSELKDLIELGHKISNERIDKIQKQLFTLQVDFKAVLIKEQEENKEVLDKLQEEITKLLTELDDHQDTHEGHGETIEKIKKELVMLQMDIESFTGMERRESLFDRETIIDRKILEVYVPTQIETVGGLNLEMVLIEGGTFTMGCTPEQGDDCYGDERPAHEVTVSDFYIGKYEITQKQWRKVMGSDPSEAYFKGCDDCPVERVSWDEAQQFIRELNRMTRNNYRLPTEAEWEFAARGGNKSQGFKYAGSNNLNEVAWYDNNSGRRTHPVGQKKPNELGLYDMSGNAWEWCSDWYGRYTPQSKVNPQGPASGTHRIYRGGGYNSNEVRCRVTNRYLFAPEFSGTFFLGLRLALDKN